MKTEAGALREKPWRAMPVAQVGDVVDGRTVTGLNVYDQIAKVNQTDEAGVPQPYRRGEHKVAFWASTSGGHIIVRAERNVPTPLIFVPGIAGSELYEKVSETQREKLFPSLSSTSIAKLSLHPAYQPKPEVIATDVVRQIPIPGTGGNVPLNFYKPLLEHLTSQGGFKEYDVNGKPEFRTEGECDCYTQAPNRPSLFVFAYDWRRGNAENVAKLKDYIACIQKFYAGTKVNILAHSMGGLLARRYILDNPNEHHVDKMITVGSPWLGAPKAIYTMETGEFFDNILDRVTKTAFKEVVPHFKGVHELLPSAKYFELGGQPFFEMRDINGNGVAPQSYSYDELYTLMNGRFQLSDPQPYTASGYFHANSGQDDWSGDSSGVDYHILYGNQPRKQTIEQIIATPTATNPPSISQIALRFRVKRGKGDGTVPLISARRSLYLNDSAQLTVFPQNPGGVPAQNRKTQSKLVDHLGLTKNPDVWSKIFSILDIPQPQQGARAMAQNEQQEIDDFSNEDFPYSESHYVTIEGLGRRIEITDEEGNTNTPVGDGSVELSVPDVSRDGGAPRFADPETTHGLNFGAYEGSEITIRFRAGSAPINIDSVRGEDNFTPTLAVRYRDVQLPQGVNVQLKFVASTVEDMRYDADGDGVFETVVQPTVSLTGAAAQDIDAPVLTITPEPQGATQRVTINATDAGSGVKAIFYSLNGTSYQPYTAPLSLDATQTHTVYAYADDNAANRSAPIATTIKASVTLTPVADAYVKGSTPDVNFGAAIDLQVKRTLNPGTGKGRQAYLRFDTSSVTGNVTRAVLRVYGNLNATIGANNNLPCAVFPVSAVWDETTLVWNNKPAPNVPSELARVIVADTTARWYEFDITSFINAERTAGRSVTGVLLRNMEEGEPGDYFTAFNSKEAATNQPQLVIEK